MCSTSWGRDGMARIVWEFRQPREKVWMAIMDAELWPVGFVDFSPTAGAKFRSKLIPTAGTNYTGTLLCEVLEAVDFQSLSVRIYAQRGGAPPTVWEIRSELTDKDTGGTSAVMNVYGTNADEPEERILLNILGAVTRWIYGRAEKDLGSADSESKAQ